MKAPPWHGEWDSSVGENDETSVDADAAPTRRNLMGDSIVGIGINPRPRHSYVRQQDANGFRQDTQVATRSNTFDAKTPLGRSAAPLPSGDSRRSMSAQAR